MTLQNILDANTGEQLDLDDLLAAIAQEERGDGCEFEQQCYAAQGIEAWKMRRGELVQVYKCEWQSTDVGWCTKRKQYLNGDAK